MQVSDRETGLLCNSNGKESACNAGDQGLILGSGRSSGEGHGKENPMDREAWQATVRGVTESDTPEQQTHTQ